MATHTVNAQAERGSPAKGVEASPLLGARFFSINASYSIDADSSEQEALHNDFRCLFLSGLAVMEAERERLNQAQYAALYLFRQASGILDALDITEGEPVNQGQGEAPASTGPAAELRGSTDDDAERLAEMPALLSEIASGIDATIDALNSQPDGNGAAVAVDLLGRLGWMTDICIQAAGGMPVKGDASAWLLTKQMQAMHQTSQPGGRGNV